MIWKRVLSGLLICLITTFLLSCDMGDVQDAISDETEKTQPEDAEEQKDAAFDGQMGIAFQEDSPLNPYLNESRLNLQVSRLIYEGLFKQGPTFETEALLCEEPEILGNVWVITLKSGIQFQNGAAVTSKDVKYSLDLARKSEAFQTRLKNIISVKAVDEKTIQITLSKPDGTLDAKLCVPIIPYGEGDLELPSGTGPYIVSQSAEKEMKLIPSVNWHQQKTVPFQEISLIPIDRTDMLVYGFETYEIDVVAESKISAVLTTFRGDAETYSYPTSQMLFLGVNTQKAPFENALVRSALSRAIDRDNLGKQELASLFDPSDIPYNPAGADADVSEADVAASAKDAEALLESAGMTKDESGVWTYQKGSKRAEFTVDILCNADNQYMRNLAKYLAEAMSDIGVRTTITEQKFDAYSTKINSRDFDVYIGHVLLPAGFELDAFLEQGGALNKTYYANAELLKQYEDYRGARGQTRLSMAESFFAAFRQEYPFIPLGFARDVLLTAPALATNITPSEQNIFYDFEDWGDMPGMSSNER